MIWQFVTQAASTQGICIHIYNGALVFLRIKLFFFFFFASSMLVIECCRLGAIMCLFIRGMRHNTTVLPSL